MTDTRWERLAAAGGFISVVLSLAYIFLSPGVDALAPASEVASVYTKNREGALFWNFIGTLSFFFFLFFLGALYNVLRRAEGGTGWLSLVAFSGGLAQIAIHSVETLAAYTLAWHVAEDGNLAVIQALFDLQNLAVYYWAIPVAAMLTATSIITVRTLVFPRWLGWVGFVIAMGWLVAAAGVVDPHQGGPLTAIGELIALIGFELVWMPATSFFLMRRAGATPSGAEASLE